MKMYSFKSIFLKLFKKDIEHFLVDFDELPDLQKLLTCELLGLVP